METLMRTVLITGANRGIGLEHARRYAERGARVFATARKPDEADELAALAKRIPKSRCWPMTQWTTTRPQR
jgi:NAD(P)-dependent dehydrogenase (short-subunit alcohol dehydrogenase family)